LFCPGNFNRCNSAKHGMKRHCLLAGIVDLEHIIIDELHLFLRLWDLIMNILLGYVEAVDREDVLERISIIFKVLFH
jgi:hypothetical protein